MQFFLRNLDLRVDAWAVSLQDGEEKSPVEGSPTRDLIASQPVQHSYDPVTLVHEDNIMHNVRLQLWWEVMLTLGRPRIKSIDQSVIFVPVVTILGDSTSQADSSNIYLEPFSKPEPNLLQGFGPLPGLRHPFLSQSSLERLGSLPSPADNKIRVRSEASEPIPARAATLIRLKYSKMNTMQPEPMTVASLDLEVLPIDSIRGEIERIEASLVNGIAMPLMSDLIPLPFKSRDSMTFLYHLQSALQSGTSTPVKPTDANHQSPPALNIDMLSIQIHMRLFLSTTTTAIIQTSWTTSIDFTQALNPAFGAPSQALQRTNRPTSLNFAPYSNATKPQGRDRADTTITVKTRPTSTLLQHQMIPSSIPRQSTTSILSISFTAPDTPAIVGKPFSWQVLVVNNSPKPIKLAIVPLPRIPRPTNTNQQFAKRHAPKASNSTLPANLTGSISEISKNHTRHIKGGSIAKAVVEDHVLYALHHQAPLAGAAAIPAEADIISLTAELRVGPLGVGQCHEAEIRFVAYKSGLFNMDAIRVVDLAGEGEGKVGAINDIRDLPEVYVVAADHSHDL